MYRNGRFRCTEISGFVLTGCQQLEGSFFGFERYLVIEKGAGHSEGRAATSILIADGDITRSNLAGSTVATVSHVCDENIQWHKYDMHSRFRTLSASTVSSRLYLSALHAATSFLSPDCDSLLTGFERAIELVRGSWVARVLSREEIASLSKLRAAFKGRHPSLSLLCTEVMQSSMSVSFLHGGIDSTLVHEDLRACPDATAKYLNDLESGILNSRNRLTASEERRILGQCGRTPCRTRDVVWATGSPPVQMGISKQMEDAVRELGVPCKDSHDQNAEHEFPLHSDSQTVLESDIVAKLYDSWVVHQKLSKRPDDLFASGLSTHIARLQLTCETDSWGLYSSRP